MTGYISDQTLQDKASQLLARYERKHTKVTYPPIPVERIVENFLGLNIVWEGIPEPRGKTILAGLNALEGEVVFNEKRRRVFDETAWLYNTALAHESGHWEVHVDKAMLQQPALPGFNKEFRCLYKSDGPGQEPEEVQAHKFMAYLLIPSSLLTEAIQGLDLLEWQTLYRLRDLFRVTISALTIRLERLNLLYIVDGELYPSRQEYEGQRRLMP